MGSRSGLPKPERIARPRCRDQIAFLFVEFGRLCERLGRVVRFACEAKNFRKTLKCFGMGEKEIASNGERDRISCERFCLIERFPPS